MHWLESVYGDRMGAWKCDVAKACHHGSHDISYRFLKAMEPSATVISSGDAEGHAHPRPEVVAASAMTGFVSVDLENDKLLTPLIYMTEIERSVTLGAINRMDFKGVTVGEQKISGTILGRPIDEINDMGFVPPSKRHRFRNATTSKQRRKIAEKIRREEAPALLEAEEPTEDSEIRIDMNLTVPLGPVDKKNVKKK